MAQAKTELFDEKLVETAALFKALAHPARLQILQFLSESDSCITGDISEELPLGRTTVNQHLKELKAAGLIKGHIEGATTLYCLDNEKMKQFEKTVSDFIHNLDLKNYICK